MILPKNENQSNDKQKAEKQNNYLCLLEEDDEFEEFPVEDWAGKDKDDEDVSVWEDNWEDDNVEDDFNVQLKSQLVKQEKMQT